ncbi:TlpA family protein disulfide reductase [Fulvivirga sp. RKSG066]|uniref:TlpA family protein disulfide reductase n=1 Tax=Fulvivirga aurantia TaxID=2529383 RepID=UPI0012BCC7F9|nr:TlpA disulfide reductase family protein [Fulvivirga aurantia]MTI22743.1 TlpA family protein disulfide reductase [Fulvivirga aurantia]
MRFSTTILVFLLVTTLGLQAQELSTGDWIGKLQYENQEVPFAFELLKDANLYTVVIKNGEERISLNKVKISGDSLFIPLGAFDATLKGKFTENSITGVWVKNYRASQGVPFFATPSSNRFDQDKSNVEVGDRWKILFDPESSLSYQGIGLWEQDGNSVTGTILTETSDYRYFEGVISNDSIKVSSFDGAHAFLMIGKKTGDKWQGEFHFDSNYKENWEAEIKPDAELPDPWEVVEVDPGTHRPYYDILAAGSGQRVIDESKYFGKVLVIQLFGTWCPNSLDETKYLKSWYDSIQDNNVELLSITYEPNYSKAYGLQRIEDYKLRLELNHEVLLGGQLSKSQAALAFPFMDKIKAFPTLILVDKYGYVRFVHSYFNGPATGAYYEKFDEEFNKRIELLLAE